jgi:hypothetical protein
MGRLVIIGIDAFRVPGGFGEIDTQNQGLIRWRGW